MDQTNRLPPSGPPRRLNLDPRQVQSLLEPLLRSLTPLDIYVPVPNSRVETGRTTPAPSAGTRRQTYPQFKAELERVVRTKLADENPQVPAQLLCVLGECPEVLREVAQPCVEYMERQPQKQWKNFPQMCRFMPDMAAMFRETITSKGVVGNFRLARELNLGLPENRVVLKALHDHLAKPHSDITLQEAREALLASESRGELGAADASDCVIGEPNVYSIRGIVVALGPYADRIIRARDYLLEVCDDKNVEADVRFFAWKYLLAPTAFAKLDDIDKGYIASGKVLPPSALDPNMREQLAHALQSCWAEPPLLTPQAVINQHLWAQNPAYPAALLSYALAQALKST